MSRHLWGLVQDVKWKNNVMTDIQVVNIEENLRIKGVISRMQNFSWEKCTMNGWYNNAWKGFRFVQSNSMLPVSHWDLKKYYSWSKSSHTLETTDLCPDMSKVFYEELNKRNYYNCK